MLLLLVAHVLSPSAAVRYLLALLCASRPDKLTLQTGGPSLRYPDHGSSLFYGKTEFQWQGRGYFAASSGNVTDEVIMEYIATQDLQENDGDFNIAP